MKPVAHYRPAFSRILTSGRVKPALAECRDSRAWPRYEYCVSNLFHPAGSMMGETYDMFSKNWWLYP